MTRPESHRDQIPEKRCGNCAFSQFIQFKRDLLCFHGDESKLEVTYLPSGAPLVVYDGFDLSVMDHEDGYDDVWGGRSVDDDEVCDEWKPEELKRSETHE